MQQPTPYHPTTWFFKACQCLLAGFYTLTILIIPLELLPPSFFAHYGDFILPVVGALALLATLVYTRRWQQQERFHRIDSGSRHAWMQAIIRYWLALVISLYGFGKLLKTQLQPTVYDFDTPLGEVSGYRLTWFFFGYSYPLVVIIGLLQLGGALLLLYRRTRLLGVMILLPVMVNIVLINLFYAIDEGAFVTSILIILGLLFLLLLDWAKLKAAFWEVVDPLPMLKLGRHWIKPIVRLLPFLVAFSVVYNLSLPNAHNQVLKGIWQVQTLTRNGQTLPTSAWLRDTTAWNRVYFTGKTECAFSANPYRYRPQESWRGAYQYDSITNRLQVVFLSRGKLKDTLQGTIQNRMAGSMQIQGTLGGDTLSLQLARLR